MKYCTDLISESLAQMQLFSKIWLNITEIWKLNENFTKHLFEFVGLFPVLTKSISLL